MVAIQMTGDGPIVDPVAGFELHPVIKLFDERTEPEIDALQRDLKENGQRDPVLLDVHGRLVDGRARLRALHRLGVRPVVSTLTPVDNPWLVGLHANRRRFDGLTVGQRGWYGARVPAQARSNPGRAGRDPTVSPPFLGDLAQVVGVSTATIGVVRRLLEPGVAPELVLAVARGLMPPTMAERVSAQLPYDGARDFGKRVLGGANPDLLTAAWGITSRTTERRRGSLPEEVERAVRNPQRHRHIELPAIDALMVALSSFRMVTEDAQGLDPDITPDQAKKIIKNLSRERSAIAPVMKLLRERQGREQ